MSRGPVWHSRGQGCPLWRAVRDTCLKTRKVFQLRSPMYTSFCSCRWGATMSLNCGHKRECFFILQICEHGATGEWYRQGKLTEELGENVSLFYFVHHRSHVDWPGSEPGPPRWEPATNHLSHGTAPMCIWYVSCLITLLQDNKWLSCSTDPAISMIASQVLIPLNCWHRQILESYKYTQS
jgi:hypothetical protein